MSLPRARSPRIASLIVAALSLFLQTQLLPAADDTPILAPGALPKLLVEHGVDEGPAWHPDLGLLCSGEGHIQRLDHTGKFSVYRRNAGTNGLLFDTRGRLLACESKSRRITRTELDGTITLLTDNYNTFRYNQPNDITLDSRGRIYFSDPRYGSREDMQIKDANGREIEGVYRIDPDGRVTRIISHEVDRPNGLLVSADDRTLFVSDNNNSQGGARKLFRFDLKTDGTVDPTSRKVLFDWGTGRGPDGLKQDTLGRLYVAGGLNKPNPPHETADRQGGIYVLDPKSGQLLEFIHIDRDEVTNCAFGGPDRKTLYITAGGTLWSIPTQTPGQTILPTK